jgi:hypothetical protein
MLKVLWTFAAYAAIIATGLVILWAFGVFDDMELP